MFQKVSGERLEGNAIRMVCRRLSEATGINFQPHALRRSFATLSLKSGMDVITLQRLMGHSSVEMTAHYAQLLTVDLIEAHQAHGALDSL